MENAVDALKIAAAILVFIIAISSSFSLFGTAKHTADSIITMRDKQAYLEAAEVDGGILYTSTDAVSAGKATGVNTNGDRIVGIEDVVSSIYRYSKEKYGVTILKANGTVLARYDSNTDNVMNQWYNIVDGQDANGNNITEEQQKNSFADKIKENISTKYLDKNSIDLEVDDLVNLYYIDVEGNSKIKCGAPWYGNEDEIQKKISCDLNGETYTKNKQTYNGKKLLQDLKGKKIVEVTNEIDQSTYLKDTDDEGNEIITNLLQQYEMPTVEIVYIIMN